MKIKEVIDRTGLTDRAIRLYIANGLVKPQNEKTYAGRNQYDFNEEDVKALKQIALLRKADFSIEQIQVLQQGGQRAQETIKQYLQTKRAEVAVGRLILSVLEKIPTDGDISLETICAKLEDGLYQKAIPDEDMKPTRGELQEARTMRTSAGVIASVFGAILVWFLIMTYKEFPYWTFYNDPGNYVSLIHLGVPIILMTVVILLYRKHRVQPRKRKVRIIVASVLLAVTVLHAVNPLGMIWLVVPVVYSETDDPADYLQLGSCDQAEAYRFEKLFPARIPRSAIAKHWDGHSPEEYLQTTKYYYKHEHDLDPYYDIYAEWVLPEEDYAIEKQRVLVTFGNAVMEQKQWGDWVCVSFDSDPIDEAAALRSYYYLIFAYNDKTSTVRYITSSSTDWGESVDPYFLSLEW